MDKILALQAVIGFCVSLQIKLTFYGDVNVRNKSSKFLLFKLINHNIKFNVFQHLRIYKYKLISSPTAEIINSAAYKVCWLYFLVRTEYSIRIQIEDRSTITNKNRF